MFSKILPTYTTTRIYGASSYMISVDGRIVKCKDLEPVEMRVINNERVCTLRINGVCKDFRLIDLMAICFKDIIGNIPVSDLDSVIGFHIDGDAENFNLSNIGYRFKNGKLENKYYPGFYYIPEHLRFGISENGECISFKTGQLKPVTFTLPPKNNKAITAGYANWRYTVNNVQKGIGRHRALMMVFTDYPDNVDTLQVNHINGIPGDDRLDNLEWSTPGGNLDHAYRNNLRSQNVKVIAYNLITGETVEHHSICAAAKALNYSDMTVGNIYNGKKKVTITKEGWTFTDDLSKLNHAKLRSDFVIADQKVGCIGINTTHDTRYEFISINQAAEMTGVKAGTIGSKLKRGDTNAINGWVFKKIL